MEKVSFLNLILKLEREEKTGLLKIKKDQIEKLIYFKKGRIIYIDSSLRYENLGRILVEQKKISEEHFTELLKKVEQSGKRQGEVLVELGFMSPFEVFEALKEQLAKKLSNCFILRDFGHEFMEGEKHLANITEIPINIKRTLIDGVQTSYTHEILKEEAEFAKDMVPFIKPEQKAGLNSIGLRPDETKLLRLFDGRQTLFNILKSSGMDPQFVMSTSFVLNAMGFIEYKKEEERKVQERPSQFRSPRKDAPIEEKHKTEKQKDGEKEEVKKAPDQKEGAKAKAKGKDEENKGTPQTPEELKAIPPEEIKKKDSPLYEIYLTLDTQGYLEFFGLSVKFNKNDLKTNYENFIKKYRLDRIDEHYGDKEERLMAERILDKAVTVFTILKDEKKKDIYLKERARIIQPKQKDDDNLLKAEIEMNKSTVYKRKNNLPKAEYHLRRAISYNPNEIEYMLSLADVLLSKSGGKKEDVKKETEEIIRKAISIDTNNYNGYLQLGIYYKFIGERQKAINCFNKTLELNPGNQRANAELRLFNIRGEKKPLFSFLSLKPKEKPKKEKAKEEEEGEEEEG